MTVNNFIQVNAARDELSKTNAEFASCKDKLSQMAAEIEQKEQISSTLENQVEAALKCQFICNKYAEYVIGITSFHSVPVGNVVPVLTIVCGLVHG